LAFLYATEGLSSILLLDVNSTEFNKHAFSNGPKGARRPKAESRGQCDQHTAGRARVIVTLIDNGVDISDGSPRRSFYFSFFSPRRFTVAVKAPVVNEISRSVTRPAFLLNVPSRQLAKMSKVYKEDEISIRVDRCLYDSLIKFGKRRFRVYRVWSTVAELRKRFRNGRLGFCVCFPVGARNGRGTHSTIRHAGPHTHLRNPQKFIGPVRPRFHHVVVNRSRDALKYRVPFGH